MNINEPSFMTQMLESFKTIQQNGAAAILPEVMTLMFLIGVIEIALTAILKPEQDHIMTLAVQMLKVSFFVWLAQNWVMGMDLCGAIFLSFEKIGVLAAGASEAVVDPSNIAENGIRVVSKVLDTILASGSMGAMFSMANIANVLMKIVIFLVIVFCTFFMALQLFITTIEYYVVTTLGAIFLPFGIYPPLSNLAASTVGGIIKISVRMMVLQFMLCVSVPLVEQWVKIPGDGTIGALLSPLLGVLSLAVLCWKAPEMASGLCSGNPTLSASSVVQASSTAARSATNVSQTVGHVYNQAKERARQASTTLRNQNPFSGEGKSKSLFDKMKK